MEHGMEISMRTGHTPLPPHLCYSMPMDYLIVSILAGGI